MAPFFTIVGGYQAQFELAPRPSHDDAIQDYNEGEGKPNSIGHCGYLSLSINPLLVDGGERYNSVFLELGTKVTFGQFLYDQGWVDETDWSDPANPPDYYSLTNVHVERSLVRGGVKAGLLLEKPEEHMPKWHPSIAVLFFQSTRTDRASKWGPDGFFDEADKIYGPQWGFTAEVSPASVTMGPDKVYLDIGLSFTSDPSIGTLVPGLVLAGGISDRIFHH